jgi:hypothetical protein
MRSTVGLKSNPKLDPLSPVANVPPPICLAAPVVTSMT